MEVSKEIKEFIEKLAERAIDVGSLGYVSEYISEYTSQVEKTTLEVCLILRLKKNFKYRKNF